MHFFFSSIAIFFALASAAMPAAAGTSSESESTRVHAMLRSKANASRSVEVAPSSYHNEITNLTSPLMDLISSDNNAGLSSYHQNETMTPTGQLLPMEDLARSMQAMTDRDRQYLISHNTRRKVWHERYNRSYVPLKWDNALKAEAKVWAEHLLASCGKGMYHDPNAKYGECATANMGTGSFAKLHTTDEIVRRYVEREVNWQPPQNSHLTQVLWRSTKYVGCAEASISMGGGKMCHTSVCRYARPGNCNMGKYRSDQANWWIVPMMMDEGGLCGPACPPNGCH